MAMAGARGTSDVQAEPVRSSGIEGLDSILRGGFSRTGVHLIQGGPGTGKTTLALQYLIAGVAEEEPGVYVTVSQSRHTLERIARSHGWSLRALTIHELSPGELAERSANAAQTVLHTADIELNELTRELRSLIDEAAPARMVLDSLGTLRLLASNRARYHRELLLLRDFLMERDCTALFLDDLSEAAAQRDPDIGALSTSTVVLKQVAPEYGEARRSLRIVKVRGVSARSGNHDFRIRTGGIEVFPRLEVSQANDYREFATAKSGIATLDRLLGGGLEYGTTCLIVGPPGVGKSTLTALFAGSAAEAGTAVALFLFDERPTTFEARARGLGVSLQPHLESNRLSIQQLDLADISAGEFTQRVRRAVVDDGCRVVVLDSLTGYFNSLRNTETLSLQLHELLTFLSRRGVLTLLTVAQPGFMSVGELRGTDVSYLSDSVILMRMFEADGRIRRCLAAVKKRQGEHETTLREVFIKPGSVQLSQEPLREFSHLLTGQPSPATQVAPEP